MTRHLVVTGTSTGLGRAIAVEARRRGWKVLGTVRREADRGGLEADGVDTAICDICDPDAVETLGRDVAAWSAGRLDALVNNAGTTYPGPIEVIEPEDLRAQFEVNVFAQVAVTRALLGMLRATGGRIVMISSDSTQAVPPAIGAYAASKMALEGIARSLDLEVRPQGVSVHIVRPGAFETAIWETSVKRADEYGARAAEDQVAADRYAPLAAAVRGFALDRDRMGDPADLARATVDVLEARRPRMVTTFPRTLENFAASRLPWWVYRQAVAATLEGTAGRTRRGRRARS